MNAKILSLAKASALTLVAVCTLLATACNDAQNTAALSEGGSLPDEITIDYAVWSPLSLALREKGFLEEEFRDDNVKITWILTHGGNKSMEFLMSGSVDVVSSPGISPLLSYISGSPVTIVSLVSVQSFVMIVPPDSGISDVSELRGKTVSATPGTATYLYAIKSLASAGLGPEDVNIVPLQFAEGFMEVSRGRVDAYAGAEPQQSIAENEGLKALPDNTGFRPPLVLSANSEFLKKYPHVVKRIISAYGKARKWAEDNPAELAALVGKQNNLPPEVAGLMIKRLDLRPGEIGDEFRNSLIEQGEIFKQLGVIRQDVDLQAAVSRLTDNSALGDI